MGRALFISGPGVMPPHREVGLGDPRHWLLTLSKLLATLRKEKELLIGKFFPMSNLNPAAFKSLRGYFWSLRLGWDARLRAGAPRKLT